MSCSSEQFYSARSGEVEQSPELSSLQRHNVRIIGQGTELLFFSHGFGTSQKVWDGVLAHLDLSRYRIILWDVMGAYSTNPDNFDFQRYASLHAHADDLLEVLEDLEVESVTFVGHSVSGMIGVLASIEAPELFKKLVLIAPSCRYINDPETGYIGGFNVSDLDEIFAAIQNNYTVWVSGYAPMAVGDSIESPSVREFSRTLFLIRPDIAFSTLKMIFTTDFRSVLSQVTCPVRIIQTERDPAVPLEVVKYMASNLEDATLEMVPLEGHLPHLTHPSVVAPVIIKCLGS